MCMRVRWIGRNEEANTADRSLHAAEEELHGPLNRSRLSTADEIAKSPLKRPE